MKNSANLARYIQSLATVLQESAETGQMDSAVYADLLELLAELAGMIFRRESYTEPDKN